VNECQRFFRVYHFFVWSEAASLVVLVRLLARSCRRAFVLTALHACDAANGEW